MKSNSSALWMCLLPATCSIAQAQEKKPNIVVILTDDMGWSDFGCYGSEIHTPTIDSLANHGLRYRQFYNAARSSPTRCALMTGLYTQQVAVDPSASLPNLRSDNNVTIAEVLKGTGYRTYLSGKWHLGNTDDKLPRARGFDHAFGLGAKCGGANLDAMPGFWDITKAGLQSESNEITWDDYAGKTFHMTDATGDYAKRFIKHNASKGDNKPFFLYMAFNAAHWPVNGPAEIANHYTDIADPNPGDEDYYRYEVGWDKTREYRFNKQMELGVINESYKLSPRGDAANNGGFNPAIPIPAWDTLDVKRQNDLARRMALYAATVEQIDNNVEKVIQALKETGELENTFIFILADNGGNYENHTFGNPNARETADLFTMGQANDPHTFPRVDVGGGWAHVNNTPFRMFKHFTHEGGIRTPGILFYPKGVQNPGTWVEQPCHLIDIMPTIVEISSAAYPATYNSHEVLPMEGKSLVPHFTGQTFEERPIFVEHETNRAWFEGDYKLVTKHLASSDGSSPADMLELYNMKLDPSELNNLAMVETERLLSMIKAWNEKALQMGVPAGRLINTDIPVCSDEISLLFHFPFDNDVTDTSPAHYTLTPRSSYTPVFGAGKFGAGIVLNGTSDYLDLNQTDIFNPKNQDFTVCAWVYNTLPENKIPENGSLEQQVLHQLGGGRIMLNAQLGKNSATIGTFMGGKLYEAPGNVFSQNKWQHIAIVSRSCDRTHTFYVDGVNVGTIGNANAFESVTDGFRVGAHKDGTRSFWGGTIDELYLFDGHLSEAQINLVKDNRVNEIFKPSNISGIPRDFAPVFYPNPAKSVVNFSQSVDKVRVLDLNGRMVLEKNTPTKSINLDKLTSATYLLLIQKDSNIFMNKLIKQ